jgi:hypothetical protein
MPFMNDTLDDSEIAHPLNEALLQEAEDIKTERKLLKDRLDKLGETRTSVSDAVYQKVRADYAAKMNRTTEKLIALKKGLEVEERTLVEKKLLVEAHLKLHAERIEEATLRHALGEFTMDEHTAIRIREEKEIGRLETAHKKLEEGLERHRGIFEGEDIRTIEKPIEKKIEKPAEKKIENTSKIRIEDRHTGTVTAVERPPVTSAPPSPPATPQKVSELSVLDNGKVIQTVALDHNVCIGRSPANDVVLKEPKVSRKHAEIQYVGGKYILMDLESSNGTYVGGKKVAEYALQPNDEITIGNTKMVFKG